MTLPEPIVKTLLDGKSWEHRLKLLLQKRALLK